jgi:hypothetical protein
MTGGVRLNERKMLWYKVCKKKKTSSEKKYIYEIIGGKYANNKKLGI